MKKIELKSILLYTLLVVVTMIVVFGLGNLYKNRTKFTKEKSVLNEIVSSIQYNELESYKMENPNFVLFVSNDDAKKQEEILKDVIMKNGLQEEIIYLEYDHPKRIQQLKNKYVKTEFSIPNLLVFENGMYKSNFFEKESSFQEKSILKFLKEEGIIE